jgi:mRNA interferase YafQ
MTSIRTAASKRASLPRAADYTKAFQKDWERDHELEGDWKGHRECHIGGDFLLAYKLDDAAKHGLIVFVRTGTHADLFE